MNLVPISLATAALASVTTDLGDEIIAIGAIGGALWGVLRWARKMYSLLSKVWNTVNPESGLSHQVRIESLEQDRVIEVAARRFTWSHDPDAMVEWDAAGSCVWVNGPAAALYGLEVSEMLGRDWLSAVDSDVRQDVWSRWMQAVREGIPYEDVYEVRTHTGSRRRVHVRAIHCAHAGKVVRFFGIIREVKS